LRPNARWSQKDITHICFDRLLIATDDLLIAPDAFPAIGIFNDISQREVAAGE
jgi:hypothetical protein